jgi:hypothetical protein
MSSFNNQRFLADMDNTLEESKRIWRTRQEYFAVFRENAEGHKF